MKKLLFSLLSLQKSLAVLLLIVTMGPHAVPTLIVVAGELQGAKTLQPKPQTRLSDLVHGEGFLHVYFVPKLERAFT